MGAMNGIERVLPLVFIITVILASSSIPEIAGQTTSSNSFALGELHVLWLSNFHFFLFKCLELFMLSSHIDIK